MASRTLSFHPCSPILIPLPILDKKDGTFGALQYKCAPQRNHEAGPRRLAWVPEEGLEPAAGLVQRLRSWTYRVDEPRFLSTGRDRSCPPRAPVPDAVRTQRGQDQHICAGSGPP